VKAGRKIIFHFDKCKPQFDIFIKKSLYGEKSDKQDIKLEVLDNKINVIGLGYVISERTTGFELGDNLVLLLVIGIIILVLINVAWFLFLRRKLKK